LRSRRFLRAGVDPRITEERPGEIVMSQQRRAFLEEVHDVSFAPAALARRLVADDEAPEPQRFVGFLSALHPPQLLVEEAVRDVVARVPHDFLRGDDFLRPAEALLMRGTSAAAKALLARRQALGTPESDPKLLGWLIPGS
jgi:hypothetical protein